MDKMVKVIEGQVEKKTTNKVIVLL